jgi:hypothetical protein
VDPHALAVPRLIAMQRALAAGSLVFILAACGVPAPAPVRPPHRPASRSDEVRPTDTSSNLMWRYQPTDVVESFAADGGDFRVHFTRAGVNAVPLVDADDGGIPDFVEAVSQVYEAVGATYHAALGFRHPLSDGALPDNGGDEKFDVYLLDFARSADGAFRVDSCPSAEQCIGYVVQENDFAGYGYPSLTEATKILGSHEYFHAIQAAYDNGQDAVISEGTAVWATEHFAPETDDFEAFIRGYLERPDRSLDSPPPGPVPSFAYGSAIFFEFLSQKFGDAIIRKLWEHLENGHGDPLEPQDQANPTWLVQLDALLKRDYQSSFADAFAEFCTWNLYLGSAADPTKAWANASTWPQPATTEVPAPVAMRLLRVYYASSQYFRVPSDGRTSMTAAIVDDPATADDDVAGLKLVVASRKSGVNVELVTISDVQNPTASEVVNTSGGADLLVAIINTARAGNGSILSKRPGLCAGTWDEVQACRITVNPALDAGVDAGTVDAGVMTDAGVATDVGMPLSDGGMYPTPAPQGCGCGMTGPVPTLLALALVTLHGRRRRPS